MDPDTIAILASIANALDLANLIALRGQLKPGPGQQLTPVYQSLFDQVDRAILAAATD